MINTSRYPKNPILTPNPKNPWESFAAFNGSVIKKDGIYKMVYRAMSSKSFHNGAELELSVVGTTESENGIDFKDRSILIKPDEDFDRFGCEDPRVTFMDGKYYVFYTALSQFPFNANGIKVGVAVSVDLKTIQEKHLVTPFNAKAATLLPDKINGKYALILAVNTDLPPSKIAIAYFDNLDQLWDTVFWEKWYKTLDEHVISLAWSDADQVEVGATPIKTEHGWLLIYCNIRNYFTSAHQIQIKGVMLDINDPQNVIGIIDDPLLTPEEKYEIDGNVPNTIFPTGALIEDDELLIYYSGADTNICLATLSDYELYTHLQINNTKPVKFAKFDENPLLSPIKDHDWEAKAVLNPAAIKINGKIYLIYRAIGNDNVSKLGLAISSDGIHIDERLPDPIYSPRENFEKLGCEDPRITQLDDKLYICYTAYDGEDSVRAAMSSITLNDFLERKWNWEKPMLVTAPGIYDKDACILPEKVNDKYVFFHRIEPGISVDESKTLVFGDTNWLRTQAYIVPRPHTWDSEKIGIGPTPIRAMGGWLLIYHGISKLDLNYRVGAMLLDGRNPQLVDARVKYPILEPSFDYEKNDSGRGIVFPCGMVEMGEYLYLYYGGGDKYVCGASVKLSELMEFIKNISNKKFLKFKI